MDHNTNNDIHQTVDPTPGGIMSQDRVSTSVDLLSRNQLDSPGVSMSQEGQTANHGGNNERRADVLPGSAKRRLRKLLAQGVEYVRARELCRQPTGTLGQGTKSGPRAAVPDSEAVSKRSHKRNRSEETSPGVNPKKATKLETARPTFSEVASAIRVGIRAEDRVVSHTELALLQTSILRRMDGEVGTGGPGLRFDGCSLRDGWICITCSNTYSQKWLMERVGACEPWDGAKLVVMLEKDFPKPYIGLIWVPGPIEDPKIVLRRIKFQNDNLDCAGWRLLNNNRSGSGQTLTVSMAQSAYEALRRHGFRIAVNLGKTVVRIKTPRAPETGALPTEHGESKSSAPKTNQQSDCATTEEQQITQVATSFRGGNADIFDPQQPGPSGLDRATTRAPAAASSSSGTAQVPARVPTTASRPLQGQKEDSGAVIGSAVPKVLVGRPGRTTFSQTTRAKTQRGATRGGRGRGTPKVLRATQSSLKALVPKIKHPTPNP